MQNMTLRKLMTLSSVFTIVLLAVLIGTAWQGMQGILGAIDAEHKTYQPALMNMMEARYHIVKMQDGITDAAATGEADGLQEAERHLKEAQEHLANLKVEMPAIANRVADVATMAVAFLSEGRSMAEIYMMQGRVAGNQAMESFDTTADKMQAELEALKTVVEGLSDQSAKATEGNAQTALLLTLGLGSLVAVLTVTVAVFTNRLLFRMLGAEPAVAVGLAKRIAADDFSTEIRLAKCDSSSLMAQLEHMQSNLKNRIQTERALAAENLRVRIALDNVSTGVMIADRERKIIYCNHTVDVLLREAEADIRKDIASFQADRLIGSSIDQFHKNPQHQAGMLDQLKGSHTANLEVGGRTMVVTASPVIGDNGERLGTVAEWRERTTEVRIEREVADIVSAASLGDLSKRVDMVGKTGFFGALSEGLNQLLDTTENAINATSEVLERVAQGDLTRTIDDPLSGVFGRLKEDTNATILRLREVVGQIQEASGAINTAAREISAGNADLSSRTEEQASSLEETSSSMEELNATVKQNAQSAGQANDLARNSNELASRSGQVMKQVVHTMSGIQDSSKKIAEIITVIDSIAFQTNILALNAAVEAARAGEQGRGFAVVATEVRNLAQRSATAAKEIKALIAESVGKVEDGARLVDQAGGSIDEVVSSFQRVATLLQEISHASREQSSGIDQVAQAVSQMDEVTQQNAALVEQSAAAAESLEEQARGLVRSVAVFRLKEGQDAEPAVTTTVRPAASVTAMAPRRPVRRITNAVDRGPMQVTRGGALRVVRPVQEGDEWQAF